MLTLLQILQKEKSAKLRGGIYHKLQIEATYNSNHMEGSKLTHEQTRYIYETNTVGVQGAALNVDDIVETANHFRCIDMVIDCADRPLTESRTEKRYYRFALGLLRSRRLQTPAQYRRQYGNHTSKPSVGANARAYKWL